MKGKHRKYELTEQTLTFKGKTLSRIRALRDIGTHTKAGDLGGWVEKPENLSQDWDCWVGGKAKVFGNAIVAGNAQVSGNADVGGNAKVYGDAKLLGNTYVCGNALVFSDAIVSGNAIVSGDAHVSGKAHVSGYANVYGYATVCGDAEVFGKAKVYGNAKVCDYANVSGNARVSGNAKLSGEANIQSLKDFIILGPAQSSGRYTTAHIDKHLEIRVNVGCFSGSLEAFKQAIEATHKHNEKALKQYRAFAQVIEISLKG